MEMTGGSDSEGYGAQSHYGFKNDSHETRGRRPRLKRRLTGPILAISVIVAAAATGCRQSHPNRINVALSGAAVNASFRSGTQAGSPWPMVGADAKRNGRGIGEGATGFIKWQFETGNSIYSGPVISADDTVYFGSTDGNIYAVDGHTGKLKWAYPTGSPVESSGAIGADGTLYIGCDNDNLYALNSKTGIVRWTFPCASQIWSSPAIGPHGTVYIASLDGKLRAIDGVNGRQRWSYKTGKPIESSAAIGANGLVYIGSNDHQLYAIHTRSGRLAWSFKTNGKVIATPAIGDNGTVYVGSGGGRFYALDGNTGRMKWSFPVNYAIYAGAAITPGETVLLVASQFYGLVSKSGELDWVHEASLYSSPYGAPVVAANGMVYFSGNRLHAINGSTHKQIWTFPPQGTIENTPAIGADGTIYFGCDDNDLYAISRRPIEPKPSAKSLKPQHNAS